MGFPSGDDILDASDDDSAKKDIGYCTFNDILLRFKGTCRQPSLLYIRLELRSTFNFSRIWTEH